MNLRKTISRILRIPAIVRGLREGSENWALMGQAALDDYQLLALNAVWQDAVLNIPFYADWKRKHELPDRIVSLEDYAKWPILRKSDLQANPELLKRKTTRKYHESVTGGSTGEPLHFGTFPEQAERISASILMARAGLGFNPGDRVFLFWGHRHFYGHGVKSKIKFFIRQCKDWFNNSYRADACDLSARYLSFVGKKLNRFNPEVIIAYSASLLAFVRFAKERGLAFTGNSCKLVTLRCPWDGKITVVKAGMRFGVTNDVFDNLSSGGISVAVDAKTGALWKNAYNWYKADPFPEHPSTGVKFGGLVHPYYVEMRQMAIKYAAKIPNMNMLSWDMIADVDGKVKILEVNATSQSSDWLQFGYGGLFGEYTENVVDWCANHKEFDRFAHIRTWY